MQEGTLDVPKIKRVRFDGDRDEPDEAAMDDVENAPEASKRATIDASPARPTKSLRSEAREKSRCCSKSQSNVVAEVVAETWALSTLPERSSMSFHRIVRHGVVRHGLFPFYEKMHGE